MPVTHSLSLACHTFLEYLPGLVPIGSEVKRQIINVTLTLTHFNGRQQSSQQVSRRQQNYRRDWLHQRIKGQATVANERAPAARLCAHLMSNH